MVYVTSGLVGILNSGLELASRLRLAGHEITFVGWRDTGELIQQQGFGFERIDADQRAFDRLRRHVDESGRLRSIALARRLRRQLIASTEIEDTLRRLGPDLLIIDVEVHTAVIASRPLDIPTITRFDLLSVYRDWGVPPLHTDLDLPQDLRQRIRCRAAWATVIAQRLLSNTLGQLLPRRAVSHMIPFRYGTVSRSDLRVFARARGLRLRQFTSTTNWLAPHVYPSIPMISTTALELEMFASEQPGLHHVGPMIHRADADTRVGVEDRRRWESFRAEMLGRGLPIVYCGLGTLNRNALVRVRNVITAAADPTGWALVVGLGGQVGEPLGELPDHVLVLDYAPQLDVLASASAAVVHGGINTINECVWFEVPMALHRGGKVDQPGNASRVEHHGLGIRVDLDDGPEGIRSAIERLLGEPSFATDVAAMHRAFERYDGVLERLVDDMLSVGSGA